MKPLRQESTDEIYLKRICVYLGDVDGIGIIGHHINSFIQLLLLYLESTKILSAPMIGLHFNPLLRPMSVDTST